MRGISSQIKTVITACLLSVPVMTVAETQWELGVGVGNITASAYPGSDESVSINSPIPYLKVKTEWFDLDRDGIHTYWFENSRFSLDFSFDYGLPVDSDKNSTRSGMPDLDLVGQIGPLLSYDLQNDGKQKWQLQLPLSYAYRVKDSSLHSIGWSSNPRLYFNYLIGEEKYPLDISVSFGPVYGSEDYHSYYYSVDAAYVTTGRQQYAAAEGFGGYRLNASVTRHMQGYWLGLYLRYQNLSDAVFADSSLVNEKEYWAIAVGVSWLFAGNMK